MSAEIRSDHSLKPGDRLGPYEVLSFLAAGGMGEIYVACDTRLDRRVAVKILPEIYSQDRERLKRFEQEAQAASQINHPNIVAVYDVGERGNLPYIVTELLDGQPLQSLLHEKRLPYLKSVQLGVQIVRALAAAHEKGVIHRDLKPSNIFVTHDGHVKVLDFGLAKLTQPEWQRAGAEADTLSALSTPGVVLGSAGYMSPEQVRGGVVGAGADIFSFGVVFYEMLTGRRAFARDSPIETMSAILSDEPEPIGADVPNAIVAIVHRCLEKRAEARFASARELLFALEELAFIQPLSTSRSRLLLRRAVSTAGRSPRLLVLTAALAMVIVATLLTMQSSARPANPAPEAIRFRRALAERLTSHGRVEDLVMSADGAFMAYCTGTNERLLTLRLRHLPSGSDIELIPAKKGQYLRTAGFSPDGNFVYFRDYNDEGSIGIARVPLMGGAAQRIFSGNASRIAFAPNGAEFAFFTRDQTKGTSSLQIVSSDGRLSRSAASLSGDRRFISAPAWTTDGKRIIAPIAEGATVPRWVPLEIDAATGQMQRFPICADLTWISDIQTITGGGYLVTTDTNRNGQLWFLSADGRSCHQLTSDPVKYELGGASGHPRRFGAIGVQETYNLWKVPLTSAGSAVRLTRGINTADGEGGIALFDDGRVVFTRNDSGTPTGNIDLWVVDEAGVSRQLTNTEEDEGSPAASPDGRTVAYARTNKEKTAGALWRLELDGAMPRQLTPYEGWPIDPSFSPDGTSVHYVVDDPRTKTLRLKRIPADGGAAEDITPMDGCERGLRVSPDGKWMSCGSKGMLKIVSMATGQLHREMPWPPQASGVKWLADSSGLLFSRQRPDLTELWRIRLANMSITKVADFTPERVMNYQVTPDGKSIVGRRGSIFQDAYRVRLE